MTGTDGFQTQKVCRANGDGWQTQRRKGWLSGQLRAKKIHAGAVTIDGRKEWYCCFCPETNVWTRWRCRRCYTSIPSVLQGKHRQCQQRPEGVHRALPEPFGSRSMPPSFFLCVVSTVHSPSFATRAKWTRRWKPIWKAYVEEWEQEVHTTSPAWSISDDQLQDRECHREDSNTWFRRAHELSEQEMFACLTRADPWDESDSPCEPYNAPKPTTDDWSIPNGLPSTPPGLPSTPQSSWQPYSKRRTLGSSADMCLDLRTSQQR